MFSLRVRDACRHPFLSIEEREEDDKKTDKRADFFHFVSHRFS